MGPARPIRQPPYHRCMSELTDVLGAIESLSARGERLALATIVAVRGSTYRRPGARLLVPEEGAPIGNISGGCLENDVADVARIVMTEGHARVVSFDLTADDGGLGLGLGCNGAIELFVEPADKAAEVAGALAWRSRRSTICMVTVLSPSSPASSRGTGCWCGRTGRRRARWATPWPTTPRPRRAPSSSRPSAPRSARSRMACARSSRCWSRRSVS